MRRAPTTARPASRSAWIATAAVARPVSSFAAALDLAHAAPGRLELGLAGGRGSTDGGQFLTLRPMRGAQPGELGQRVGQLPFGLGQGGLEVQVAGRHRHGHRPPAGRHLCLGGRAVLDQTAPVALDRLLL